MRSLASRVSAAELLSDVYSLQVAFASFTDFGPLMAVAIAVHNIPEVGLNCTCPLMCMKLRSRCCWLVSGEVEAKTQDQTRSRIDRLLPAVHDDMAPAGYHDAFLGQGRLVPCGQLQTWTVRF